MKNLKIFTTLSLVLMLFLNFAPKQIQTDVTPAKNRIEVIDFHSTHRCTTCNAIEDNTLYALKKYFPNEMKAGKVTFESVNVDLKVNKEKARKFQASGTSLFLNVIVDGKETIVDLTDIAFRCGRDQDDFSQKLKTRIEAELKKL